MLRVTTLYAASAAATAAYYTRYLAEAPGEVPGVWTGDQAAALGLSGEVSGEALELLLEGRDPTIGVAAGSTIGGSLSQRWSGGAGGGGVRCDVLGAEVVVGVVGVDRRRSAVGGARRRGRRGVVARRAVRFDDPCACQRGRQFVDTAGLTIAAFRQTTSRADDPQVHTHAVISAKVATADGRWWALDARYLKRKQRMIGGIYQSVLRAELSHRFGVGWEPVVNGQAEIAGTPPELLEVFSKRAGEVEAALEHKVDEFRTRQGREPTRWEHAALTREAAVDTRAHKSGNGVADLQSRWLDEAAAVGWDGAGAHR